MCDSARNLIHRKSLLLSHDKRLWYARFQLAGKREGQLLDKDDQWIIAAQDSKSLFPIDRIIE
jgi:hypothetical protein